MLACAPRFYTALQVKALTLAVIEAAAYELLQDWAYTLNCDISLPVGELRLAVVAAAGLVPEPAAPTPEVAQGNRRKRKIDATYLAGLYTPMFNQLARELFQKKYRSDQPKAEQVAALIGMEIDIPDKDMCSFFADQGVAVFPAQPGPGAHNLVVRTKADNLQPGMLVLHLAGGTFVTNARLAVHLVESNTDAGVMLRPLDRESGEPFAGLVPADQFLLTPNAAGMDIMVPDLPIQTNPYKMFESVDLTKSPEKASWQAAFWQGASPGGKGASRSTSSSSAASSSTQSPAASWGRTQEVDQRSTTLSERDRSDASRALRVIMSGDKPRCERLLGATGKLEGTSLYNFVKLCLAHGDRGFLDDKAISALLRFAFGINWDPSSKEMTHLRAFHSSTGPFLAVDDLRLAILRLGRILDAVIVGKGLVGPFSSIFYPCQVALGDSSSGSIGSLPVDIVEEALSFALAEMCLALRDPLVDTLSMAELVLVLTEKMTINFSDLQNQTNALFLKKMAVLEAKLARGPVGRPKTDKSQRAPKSTSHAVKGRNHQPAPSPARPQGVGKNVCALQTAFHYKGVTSGCTRGSACRFSHDIGAAGKEDCRKAVRMGIHDIAVRDKVLALIG